MSEEFKISISSFKILTPISLTAHLLYQDENHNFLSNILQIREKYIFFYNSGVIAILFQYFDFLK